MSVEGSQFPSAKTKLSATTLSQRKNVSKLFPILNTPEAKLTKYQIFPAGINLNSLWMSDLGWGRYTDNVTNDQF